jgi:ABC-2 type transport system permease protein
MTRLWRAVLVIARRDFVATAWSRSFLLFLLAPVVAMGFGGLIGQITGEADVEAAQPLVAVVWPAADRAAFAASHEALGEGLGRYALPRIRAVEPAPDPRAQADRLLAAENDKVSAVLTGTLARPQLIAPRSTADDLRQELLLVIDHARRTTALGEAGVELAPSRLETVATESSSGSVGMVRHGLARGGQLLLFVLTLLLAGMLLSNLVEEKSSKVIEVLAAAVPLDAVFFGKLVAMLGVSFVGIAIWGSLAGIGVLALQQTIAMPVTPAVGWPLYCLLLLLYFTANYMLLGAVFLGIGGQAGNVREVQTLSMPVTFAQVIIFAAASGVVGNEGGALTWAAAIFPLSSPLAMIAMAAQSPVLWWHALAFAWQAFWVAVIIRLSARLFRRTVLKSGSRGGLFEFLRRREASMANKGGRPKLKS